MNHDRQIKKRLYDLSILDDFLYKLVAEACEQEKKDVADFLLKIRIEMLSELVQITEALEEK